MWPVWAIYSNHLNPVETILLPKSTTLLGNFYKSAKIIQLSSEIIFGNFYRHLAIFIWSHSIICCQNISKTAKSCRSKLSKFQPKFGIGSFICRLRSMNKWLLRKGWKRSLGVFSSIHCPLIACCLSRSRFSTNAVSLVLTSWPTCCNATPGGRPRSGNATPRCSSTSCCSFPDLKSML